MGWSFHSGYLLLLASQGFQKLSGQEGLDYDKDTLRGKIPEATPPAGQNTATPSAGSSNARLSRAAKK
jgi:hypothetical protein